MTAPGSWLEAPEGRPDPARTYPQWVGELSARLAGITAADLSRFTPPVGRPTRYSAVLILLGDTPPGPEGTSGPDVLLIERAAQMRSHAGQPAFPGGQVDATDTGPIHTAVREAVEETHVEASGVEVLRTLPDLWLPPSGFTVTPVLAYWREPSTVRPGDPAEVARVARVPVADLVDPANRMTVVHPAGFRGPGFQVADMLVWGFTAILLEGLLDLAGWSVPWPRDREVQISA